MTENACSGCPNEERCGQELLACAALVRYGKRGKNPTRKHYDRLYGLSVDRHNKAMRSMVRRGTNLKQVYDYIADNVPDDLICKVTVPKPYKTPITDIFFHVFPVEHLKAQWL